MKQIRFLFIILSIIAACPAFGSAKKAMAAQQAPAQNTTNNQQDEDNDCAICLEACDQYTPNLICGHKFCQTCISEWKAKQANGDTYTGSKLIPTCPVCRQSLNCAACNQEFVYSKENSTVIKFDCDHSIHSHEYDEYLERCPRGCKINTIKTFDLKPNTAKAKIDLIKPIKNFFNQNSGSTLEFIAASSLGFLTKTIIEKSKERPNKDKSLGILGIFGTAIGQFLLLNKLNTNRFNDNNKGKTAVAWLSGLMFGGLLAPYCIDKWSNKLNKN